MMAARTQSPVPFDARGLRGVLRCHEPMSQHTSWRVGGVADYFYLPADKEDAVDLVRRIPRDMPVTWLGLGSNLLVRDGGIEGMVIKTVKSLSGVDILDRNRLFAEAGATCAKVARRSVAAGLAGAEFLAGVPGSFGGALAMNAGAFGGETWPLVLEVECVDRQGNLIRYSRGEVAYGYRRVELPDGVALLSGVLELRPGEGDGGRQEIRKLLDRRSASQPIQSANAGSVFKNPRGDHAARIIEQAGLKGHSVGGARLSAKHANFIINEGGASARDIEALIEEVRERVLSASGIELEPEVRIIGRRP